MIELVEKYNDIWNKVSNIIKKELDCEPQKFLKTKLRSYRHDTTDFHENEIHKVDSHYTFLAVISIDFVLKNDENYYPQVFLKECKDIEKEKKDIKYATKIWEINSNSDESDEE